MSVEEKFSLPAAWPVDAIRKTVSDLKQVLKSILDVLARFQTSWTSELRTENGWSGTVKRQLSLDLGLQRLFQGRCYAVYGLLITRVPTHVFEIPHGNVVRLGQGRGFGVILEGFQQV